MKNINIKKLADLMSEKGYTKAAGKTFIEDLFEIIKEQVIIGNKVKIPEFATIFSKESGTRNCNNPMTGVLTVIPPRKTVSVVLSKKFKDDVRNGRISASTGEEYDNED